MHNILKVTNQLLAIDSPSGYTHNATNFLEQFAIDYKIPFYYNNKGNILFETKTTNSNAKTVLVASHVDTLGLMVRSINSDGTLNVTPIGGPIASTLNGEYVRVYTRDNQVYEGTVLVNSASIHVYKDANKQVEFEDLIVRLDAEVKTQQDVLDLGIDHGDVICYDPKTRITDDFINSRFLDDKLCVGIVLDLLQEIATSNLELKYNVIWSFSTYEEVGHGMAHIPANVSEIIALDMGCVGKDLNGSEHKVSICAKDSSGPYDYFLTSELVNICKSNNIDYALDIYPFYGSDASSALRAGNDIKAVLIGPGVAASHGMERSHLNGAINCQQLLENYLLRK